ncbi:multidrug transporter [Campylobacter sp. MIT 12-5580]|uniref:prepilin peptidase n=1 Tax=Campylobacter sp. MIT 12-5580 TaxID=2040651 RepID=UPI0010F96DE2|nr:A24 family peptidase [Campylobacter sp. MIT 12-5580]TKX28647.1 multidrug transporter [Campylobacter sp. MIT 12-5580]
MIILVGILGLCIGSFLTALIQRFCFQMPLFKARSFCFVCKNDLKFYHLIPLFSFVFLRGKCGFCGAKLPYELLIMECLSALFFVLGFVFSSSLSEFFVLILLLSVLLLLSLIDFYLLSVPEFLLWLAFVCAFLLGFKSEELFNLVFLEHFEQGFLLCALVFAGFMFLLKSFVSFIINFKKQNEVLESMGEADVLIVAALAGVLGFKLGFLMIFLAACLALPFLLVLKFKGEKSPKIAMIPFFSLAFVCIFFMERYYETRL